MAGLTAFRNESSYFFNAPFLSSEYAKKDIEGINEGNLFTLGRILPEFLEVDFKSIKKFPIPVFMFMVGTITRPLQNQQMHG